MAYHHSLFSGFNYCLIRLSTEKGSRERGSKRGGGEGAVKSRTQEYTGRKNKKNNLFSESEQGSRGRVGCVEQTLVNANAVVVYGAG